MTMRRERYDKISDLADCNECGTRRTMLKAERITLDDLNASAEVGDENMFYICFGCKTILQLGYDYVQEISL